MERLINTPEEAIETIKRNWPSSRYSMLIEALEMAIKSLEEDKKEEPVKPIFDHMLNDWTAIFKCPDCGSWFVKDCREADVFYCQKCGAKMKLVD